MAKRKKIRVWHKKQQKLMSSAVLKPCAMTSVNEKTFVENEVFGSPAERQKRFAKSLLMNIRKAVRAK